MRSSSIATLLGTCVAVVAALTGCTSSQGNVDIGSTSAQSLEQWQHDFQRCMGEHGIELGEGGAIPVNADGSFGGSADGADFDAAMQACEERLGPPPADAGTQLDEDTKAQILRFTKCMREAGYDMPDPDFESGEVVVSGGADADPQDVERCSTEAGLAAQPEGAQ